MNIHKMLSSICVAVSGYMLIAQTAVSADASFTGASWQVETQAQDGPRPLCTFIQKAKVLGGSCLGPRGEGAVTGSVDGKNIKWTWTPTAGLVFQFHGVLQAGGKISGALDRNELGNTPAIVNMPFVATRQVKK